MTCCHASRALRHAIAVLLAICTWIQAVPAVAQSKDELIEKLTAAGEQGAGVDGLTKGLGKRFRPDPDTNQCDADVRRRLEAAGRLTRDLYVEKAPGVDLDVVFDHNSATLSAAGRQLLATLAGALSDPRLRQEQFLVVGHTSRVGSEDYNLQLSCARSLAVRNYLREKHSIDASRLVPMGFGFAKPRDPAQPAADSNRRVEIRRLASGS